MPSVIHKSVNLSSLNFPHAKLHITTLQHTGVNMYGHYNASCPTNLFCLSNHLKWTIFTMQTDCQLSIRSHNNIDSTNKETNKHRQDTDSSQATSTLLLMKTQLTKNTVYYLIQAYSSNLDHVLLLTKEGNTK